MQKVVLITGGSSGIGQAIARSFAHDSSYRVYCSSRKAVNGEQRDNLSFVNLNVSDNSSIAGAIDFILEKEGRLDILVNNAGVGFAGPLEHTTTEEITEVFNTNVFGVLQLCRTVLPHMRKQQSGIIINISSIAGRVALPFRGVYSASKFALEGLSETLSQEVKQFGIRVVIVEPGTFNTNITENRKTTVFPSDSPYEGQFVSMYQKMNDQLKGAATPELMGKRVKEIAEMKKPALRYTVAPVLQKLPIVLKPILDSRRFESLIMNHFKIPHK